MKRVLSLLGLSVLVLGMPALADDPAPAATPAPAAAAAADSPGDACKKIVEAATKDDFAAVAKLTAGMPKKHPKKGFHKMSKQYMDRLKDLSCGGELAADDHAVVLAESGGKKRLVPFVKDGAGWLFDAKAYMSVYPHAGKHGKPGKKH